MKKRSIGSIGVNCVSLKIKGEWVLETSTLLRLIQGGHSLFVKVYKARYFPNCSFMEAEIGCNPSFVWRSLLGARELIRAGTLWHVGDG